MLTGTDIRVNSSEANVGFLPGGTARGGSIACRSRLDSVALQPHGVSGHYLTRWSISIRGVMGRSGATG